MQKGASTTPLFLCVDGSRSSRVARSAMTVDPRAGPFEPRFARFVLGIEHAEHARRFDEPIVLRDRAARREAFGLQDLVLLQDGVAPDLVAVIALRFHYRVTFAERAFVPTRST